jgi:hypothetical protein
MSGPSRIQGTLGPDAQVALDAPLRARLLEFAAALMPPDGPLPSVEEADVAGQYLDDALAARPDYALVLIEAVRRVDGMPIAEAVAHLRDAEPRLWETVTTVLPAAYLMNPDVRRSLGYGGQSPQPIDLNPAPDYEGLIDDVLRRGPIYRPTPQP